MKSNKPFILIVLLCLFMSLACSQLLPDSPTNSGPLSSEATSLVSEQQEVRQTAAAISGLYDSSWPEVIPAEIPILPGEIHTVMEAPGTRIRIFYSSVSEEQITDYLAQLEAEGFSLEYICYVEEGFPDTCDEQMARGEYDAVDITKGEYHMRLEAGGGQATYDIYTAAFMTPDPRSLFTPTPIAWPADIPSQVPIPPGCEMDAIARLSSPGYQITFVCQDEQVQADYIEALLEAGFSETDRLENEDNEIVEINLQGEGVKVSVRGFVFPYITIQVWLDQP